MNRPPVELLYFDGDGDAARRLARAAGLPAARIRRHRFPDGEVKLTLPARLPPRVAMLRSLHHPNEKLVELWMAARAARALGARHLTLVAPYLAYMRQDAAFVPGEAVSQRHVGAMLGLLFDRVVTVDPHLHRTSSLGEVVPNADAVTLQAAPLLGRFLRRHARGAWLVGPDEESAQWVQRAAEAASTRWIVGRKVRRGDRRVTVDLPAAPIRGRHVVVVDDMISTGRTLAEATRVLLAAGAARVDIAATHALFADGAELVLRAAGAGAIWTTDSVPHPTNAVRLAPLLATAFRRRRAVRPASRRATSAR